MALSVGSLPAGRGFGGKSLVSKTRPNKGVGQGPPVFLSKATYAAPVGAVLSAQDPSYLTLQVTHALLDKLIGETRFSKVDLGCCALGLVKSSDLSSHRFQRNTNTVNTLL